MATALDASMMGEAVLKPRRSGAGHWAANVWTFCRRKPLGAFGGAIVLAMLFCALFVDIAWLGFEQPLLAPSGYNDQNIARADINQGSTLSHPFGTDALGRDIFSRILYGARISIIIGLGTVLFAGSASLIIGTVSGFFGGWIDTVLQRLVDVVLAIPAVILLLFGLSVFAARAGPYVTMMWIVIFLSIIIAAGSARVVRGATIATANNQYIDAARTIGATNSRIILRHIVPNVIPVVIVLASVQLGGVILAEASISFLGYGIRDPFPSWGAMLSLSGSLQFRAFPQQAIWPGLAIALAVYGFNMFGDAIRDVLDPRLRGSR